MIGQINQHNNEGKMRKLKAVWKLLFCRQYMLVTTEMDSDRVRFDMTLSDHDVKRYGLFLYNFYTEQDEVLREVNDILDGSI
jgi:hypothetical protein